MRFSPLIKDILNKALDGAILTRQEILHMLGIRLPSLEAGLVMASADFFTREACGGRAEVHAQVGLNCSPCPNNCLFCSFAASNQVFQREEEMAVEEAVLRAQKVEAEGANAIFLMATGDYPFGKFIETAREVRVRLQPDTVMVANTGDFGLKEGKRLKEAGFTGIYHAIRMGEGKDTKISPETRKKTIEAAKESGLFIGTCVEPVGPEHSLDEIAEKILITREIQPCYSGAARRITIPHSPLEKYGMISEYRMAFLVAVVRLAMGRELIGNCTHEPNLLGAASGANLFWAEAGANPRDTEAETSRGRGWNVKSCIRLFREADYEMRKGPSVIYSKNHRKT
ncbi:MAG: radical SAM protein [Deltaproteobacteria bacterium]|nr:radical SAM protein [Deltaproteobacteria bacterium]